jgi:thiamine biosynthesis lipoprotein
VTFVGGTRTAAPNGRPRLIDFEARSMGSPLRLSLVVDPARTGERERADEAWSAVRDEFRASDAAMSRFSETSEITRLNRRAGRGEPVALSRRLRQALVTSERARRLTDGRFDPRVLVDLERLGDRGAGIELPGQPASRPRPSGRVLEPAPGRRVRIERPVDLGGIGKGLALRWAAAAVARLGVDAFLLDAGGDLVAHGQPPEGGPWRIGIEDPNGAPEPLAVVTTAGGAVATSSIRRRRWTSGGATVHHLIDPATGQPGDGGLLAVTVAGRDPAWSEVWSKTLFLAGQAAVAGLARRQGLAAWWVTGEGRLEMTAAARQRTIWTAGPN